MARLFLVLSMRVCLALSRSRVSFLQLLLVVVPYLYWLARVGFLRRWRALV